MVNSNKNKKNRGRPRMGSERQKATGFFLYPDTRETVDIIQKDANIKGSFS